MKKAIIRIFACFIPSTKIRRQFRTKMLNYFVYGPEKLQKYKEIKIKWYTTNNGEKLLPGRFNEYDLVFAVGAACPMTWELIAHKLRTFSNPFDWTAGIRPGNWLTDINVWRDTRFITKITSLCSDFSGFFNRPDIKIISNENPVVHHVISNARTKINFLHLFPVDKSIDDSWESISLKINRRCNRLIKEINGSRRVLICWGHRMMNQKDLLDKTVADTDIKKAFEMLNKKFPKTDIDLVFFEHDGTKKEFEYSKIKVCKGGYRIKSNHYIVTDSYEIVCAPIFFNGQKLEYKESLVVAEALDNVNLSKK